MHLPASLLGCHSLSSLSLLPLLEVFAISFSSPFSFSRFSCLCVCAQCVFTVTKAHSQTPPPVLTDTLRVPMAGLAFSHQVSS